MTINNVCVSKTNEYYCLSMIVDLDVRHLINPHASNLGKERWSENAGDYRQFLMDCKWNNGFQHSNFHLFKYQS